VSTPPPLDVWSTDGAHRELVRLARDLPTVDADEAWRRLGRLTEGQRAVVHSAMTNVVNAGLV
jgi:hypothetical protein